MIMENAKGIYYIPKQFLNYILVVLICLLFGDHKSRGISIVEEDSLSRPEGKSIQFFHIDSLLNDLNTTEEFHFDEDHYYSSTMTYPHLEMLEKDSSTLSRIFPFGGMFLKKFIPPEITSVTIPFKLTLFDKFSSCVKSNSDTLSFKEKLLFLYLNRHKSSTKVFKFLKKLGGQEVTIALNPHLTDKIISLQRFVRCSKHYFLKIPQFTEATTTTATTTTTTTTAASPLNPPLKGTCTDAVAACTPSLINTIDEANSMCPSSATYCYAGASSSIIFNAQIFKWIDSTNTEVDSISTIANPPNLPDTRWDSAASFIPDNTCLVWKKQLTGGWKLFTIDTGTKGVQEVCAR